MFSRPEAVGIVLDSWRFLANRERPSIYGYVILENHLQMIASAGNLPKELGDFKSFTARRIIDLLIARNDHGLLEQFKMLKAGY